MTTAEFAWIALAIGGVLAYWRPFPLGVIGLSASWVLMTIYTAGISYLFGGSCKDTPFVSCAQTPGESNVHYIGNAILWSTTWAGVCIAAFYATRRLKKLSFPKFPDAPPSDDDR
jgi:hypothetical protein